MFWVGAKFRLRGARKSLQRNIEPGLENPGEASADSAADDDEELRQRGGADG